MKNLVNILPLLLGVAASSYTNTTATAPCVSHVPQTAVGADLIITIWNQTNCEGSAGTSYPFVYEQNTFQNTFFKSYNLSRTYSPPYLYPLLELCSHCDPLHDSKDADSEFFRFPAPQRKNRLQ